MQTATDKFVGQKMEDRFQVLRLIQMGEISNLYAGTETHSDRPILIQILNIGKFGEVKLKDYFSRFQIEAEKIRQINHPNIIEVEAYGVENDIAYMVLPYFEGRTLKEELQREGALPASRVAGIVHQLAAGLEAARAHDIIHEDLTTANIYLHTTEDGSELVQIHDLGMVKIIGIEDDIDNRLTQHGDTIGTPEYLSPEQVQNQPTTYATDLYALGIITYEMLAGKPPFSAAMRIPLMLKHITDPPPPFAVMNPRAEVSDQAQAVVFRALAKNQYDRHATAEEYAEELCSALEEQGDSEYHERIVQSRQLAEAANSRLSPAKLAALFSSISILVLVAVAAYVRGGLFPEPRKVVIKLEPEKRIPAEKEREKVVDDKAAKLAAKIENLVDEGKLDKAIEMGKSALADNFGDAYIHYLMGRSYFGISSQSKAIEHFQYAKMLDPENELYRLTLERFKNNIAAQENNKATGSSPRTLKSSGDSPKKLEGKKVLKGGSDKKNKQQASGYSTRKRLTSDSAVTDNSKLEPSHNNTKTIMQDAK